MILMVKINYPYCGSLYPHGLHWMILMVKVTYPYCGSIYHHGLYCMILMVKINYSYVVVFTIMGCIEWF